MTTGPPDSMPAGDPPPSQADDHSAPAPSTPLLPLPGQRQLTVLRCALVEALAWTRRDPEDVRTVFQPRFKG